MNTVYIYNVGDFITDGVEAGEETLDNQIIVLEPSQKWLDTLSKEYEYADLFYCQIDLTEEHLDAIEKEGNAHDVDIEETIFDEMKFIGRFVLTNNKSLRESREVTDTYTVYKFEELDKEAKEKVKEWYLESQNSYVFDEMISEQLHDLFPNSNLKTQYSLSYSQGDGLNIYGDLDVNDILNVLKDNYSSSEFNELKTVLTDYVGSITLPENNTGYEYCIADQIIVGDLYFGIDYENDTGEEMGSELVKLLDLFQDNVISYFIDLCKEYEEYGYDYFYKISDEDLQDTCDANEYEFTEDGEIF